MTSKPVLYVCNVEENSAATGNAFSAKVAEMARAVLRLSPRCVIPEIIFAPPDARTRADAFAAVEVSNAMTA